jgi:hypothetical protein
MNLAVKKQKKKLKKLLDKVKTSLDLAILFAGYIVLGLGLYSVVMFPITPRIKKRCRLTV